MRSITATLASAVLLLVTGCRRADTYTATGDVVLVDVAAGTVMLNHEEIPGLMPAMTMTFPVEATAGLPGIAPGTRVRFDLRKDGARLVVTKLETIASAPGGRPGIHDHTPHHGGVVAMTGMLHLEARATADGLVQVWLTDVWRRPLPVDDVAGTVTLFPPEGARSLRLAARDGALEGAAGPLAHADVRADVQLVRAGETVDAHFLLPLQAGTTGAALVPTAACHPPADDPGARGLRPHCILEFPAAVSALAATPDGALALIGVANGGVTPWRLPSAELVTGFAPPPPQTVPLDEAPHAELVNAIAVAPDGRLAAVTLEARLLRYEIASGRLLGVLPAPHAVLRAVAWSPDGADLVVTAFYDHAAHVLRADDGVERRTIPAGGEGAGVAFAADGPWLAVGSDAGPITLLDRTRTDPPRVLGEPRRASEQLAFVGDALVAGGQEGRLWVWDAATGALRRGFDVGTPILRIAALRGRPIVALAGQDLSLRLYDVERGTPIETLAWHRAPVSGLAWAGRMLASGDTDGKVALWDLGERLAAH